MKIISFCIVLLSLSFLGCLTIDNTPDTISFWTDSNLDPENEYTLFINEEEIGMLTQGLDNVVCGTIGLLDVFAQDNKDMILELRSSSGEIRKIGLINLSSPSTGLMIKPNMPDTIYVEQDIDDPCTLVRLRWL